MSSNPYPERYCTESANGIYLPILVFAILLLSFQTGWSLETERLQTGADQIFEEPYITWIAGRRVGLITNQTGVTRELKSLPELFSDHPRFRLTALFSPEHGIAGAVQAGEEIASSPQVFSLYGQHRRPTPAMLAQVDVLVFDIQDVGARFYTYASTMLECMKAAERMKLIFIVLDRPNPIDGTRVEGPVLEEGLESFVGIAQIPIRHGMTMGELAHLLKSDAQLDLDLRIVPLAGWERSQWFCETGLPWVAPSPNMPTQTTAMVYPGLCLIEGTNLSEGRGTTLPFEVIGSPWLDSTSLTTRLNQLGLSGVRFRPHDFTPTFSKYEGRLCRGIQIHVLDSKQFRPIRTALHLLRQIKLRHPEQLKFRDSFFDQLAGNRWIREMLQEGASVESMVARWQADLQEFKKRRDGYLLY